MPCSPFLPALETVEPPSQSPTLVRETLGRGNGASRQRVASPQVGRLEDVVDLIVSETARGTGAERT